MSIWLFRAGSSGQHENKFLNDNRIYLTWDDLNVDLRTFDSKQKLFDYFMEYYPTEKTGRNRNWVGQVWPIAHEIKKDDLIILPSKIQSSIHIGRVIGEYTYDKDAQNPYYHYINVDWFSKDIPRSNFDQDLLYSFGAFMTVCRISRNDAENRIRNMAKNNWKSQLNISITAKKEISNSTHDITEENVEVDLEQYAIDIIAKYIIRKYKGHGMARIVDSILKAKGYTTFISPEGPDKGVDILAAPGNLGFDKPRICVQVKSQDTPLERTVLDQLIGTMQRFSADQGLLVSWSGFKSSFNDEIPIQFFKVRMWDQNDLIRELLNNYEKIDDELKAEIPLKRIWTISQSEEESEI